ncbi:PREDICTED: protein lifeguard 2 isoform X2 [Chinchilla lanigera]|uniref:protein lifeguard 2 isoform X2 n=1 Tax=Chinchilla lanigera TaxID=34839 RepID=UPI000697113B|nr:PREDICTED: protein lifeguard 2 isoform X2 [Chinchilla lanigera]
MGQAGAGRFSLTSEPHPREQEPLPTACSNCRSSNCHWNSDFPFHYLPILWVTAGSAQLFEGPGEEGVWEMDLEVIVPVDFSSGDHQDLVRKAAEKDAPRSGQPPKPSPAERAKESRGTHNTKADKRANIYVIQISDDSTPNESNEGTPGPFSDRSVRQAFIAKVFLILSVQLLITAMIIGTFVFCPAFFAIIIILACCGNIRREVPANYILLGLFTILEGLMLGAVSVFYSAEEVLWATAATALVTVALTIFALQTKWDFTWLNGVLFVSLCVLILYGILVLFVRSYWLHLLYAAIGTLLFSLYLVMDVQLMVGGHHSEMDPEEYVFAALEIYLDIINLFLFILQLIQLGR